MNAAVPAASRVWMPGTRFVCCLVMFLTLVFFIGAPDLKSHSDLAHPEAMPLWGVIATRIVCAAGFLVAIATAVASLVPTRMVFGSDGMLIRWAWTQRFIGFRDVLRAEVYEVKANAFMLTGVRLHFRNGSTYDIGARTFREREELLATVTRALAEHASAASDAAHEMLERGARPTTQWLRELRAMAAGAPRVAALPQEELLRVAENPAASPRQRLAASIVVAAHSDDGDAMARIRGLASTTVNPELRVALEAVASDDEAELERMLEKVE